MKSRSHLADTKMIPIGILCLLFIINALSAIETDQNKAGPKLSSLVSYDFTSNSGSLIMDRSEVKPLVNLLINEPHKVRRAKGSIKFAKGTVARSVKPPSKIINPLKGFEVRTYKAIKKSLFTSICFYLRWISNRQTCWNTFISRRVLPMFGFYIF